jgi:hypothetical protein
VTIADLGQALRVINPYDGWNPLGNCMSCAVETAMVLTSGRQPVAVALGAGRISGQGGREIVKFPEGMGNRAASVWRFLTVNAVSEGVYAVDAEDHAYNFLRDSNGQPYLIDSNQQLFLRLDTVNDLMQQGHNAQGSAPYDYNYADPTPDDDGSDMVFYFFGRIAQNWALILAQA